MIYANSSRLSGEAQAGDRLSFKPTITRMQRWQLAGFISVILLTSSAFLWYVVRTMQLTGWHLLPVLAVALLCMLEIIRLIQSLTLAVFAANARDPVPLVPPHNVRVAVLTTIVPSKEPFSLVLKTLKDMQRITPPNGAKVDVWLLDEGNEPAIRIRCEQQGIRYFSRKGMDGWNQKTGAYKARTKHGNHNAWRRAYEHNYDIVAQMDPDHRPTVDFLERTLGYFRDPSVAFVVAPQVYGNAVKSWIARASAFQAYIFHGVIQRGGNGLGAPLLIGTNHLYRTAAFRAIGGYQDSIIEDHLTSMILCATPGPDGRRWQGVYTPDIIAVGEGPATFTDYFNQQKRWAYGIWDIALRSTPRSLRTMSWRQSISFILLQFFYPSVAITWVLSALATLSFGFSNIDYHGVASVVTVLWLYSIVSSLSLFFWLRRFNLVEHERSDWGLAGMSLLLMCIPVYVSAAYQAIVRRPLTYVVTAKGKLASPDHLGTFRPHLLWLGFGLLSLTALAARGRFTADSGIWIAVHMVVCILPLLAFIGMKLSALARRTVFRLSKVRRQPAVLAAGGGQA